MNQKPASKPSQQSITLKKLMRIIYDKQKQIDKYKKLFKWNKCNNNAHTCHTLKDARRGSRERDTSTRYIHHDYPNLQGERSGHRDKQGLSQNQREKFNNMLNQPPRLPKQVKNAQSSQSDNFSGTDPNIVMTLTSEQHMQLTKQIVQNRKFLQTATSKLAGMQLKIEQLRTDLQDEQARNYLLERQLEQVKLEGEAKDREILELRAVRDVVERENTRILGELAVLERYRDQCVQMEKLKEESDKNKLLLTKQPKQNSQSFKQQLQTQKSLQKLFTQNQKIKIVSQQTSIQNNKLRQKLRNIENQVNRQLKIVGKNLRMCGGNAGQNVKNQENVNQNGIGSDKDVGSGSLLRIGNGYGCVRDIVRQKQRQQIKSNLNILFGRQLAIQSNQANSIKKPPKIKTQTHLQSKFKQRQKQKLQFSLQQKIKQFVNLVKKWQDSLIRRQQQWVANFQKSLSEHSFGGISGLVGESIICSRAFGGVDLGVSGFKGGPIKPNQIINNDAIQNKMTGNNVALNDSNFYQTSLYKRNEQKLLKQLQIQCQKSLQGQIQIQKQKLVQLSEIKQSLKMTKQVNEQLFDELNKKQNILKICKETIKSLQDKKLVKNQPEGKEHLSKLRTVLGAYN